MFKTLAILKPYLKRYRGYLFWGVLAIIATNTLALLTPMVLRGAIDRIQQGGGQRRLVIDALIVIGLALGSGFFRFWVRRTVIWASRKIEYDLRGDLFAHILTLDSSYFDRTPTGDIITRASSDVEQVRLMVGPGIMQGMNTLIVAAVAIPLMFFLDWRLALYVLLPLPLLAVLTNTLGQVAHRRFLAIQTRFSQLSASVQESLAGIRVIKSHVREEERKRAFRDENEDYFRLNMRLIKLWGGFFPLMGMLSGSAVLLILYFGGRSVITGKIGLGTFVAFMMYLGMLVWPMIALGWVVSLYQRGTASLRRLNGIFTIRSRVVDPPPERARRLPESGEIEFRRLTFAYNGTGLPALSDVTLTIRPGETVAIAGPTGSGKSTVAHLLWRRYAVPDGMMFFGGVDANHVPVDQWRSRIVVVPQEPFLFSETLRANIALPADELSEERLHEVAELAAFNKDVNDFPRGFDTLVGERGITLSGGQKQRATLARALVSPADILVLDDAFSAIDAQTEEEILGRLGRVFGTRMVILITHRISTLRRADRILFFDDGQLQDQGTHELMMEQGGAYARWATREALKEELARL